MKCPKCDTTVYRDGSVTVDCPDCGWVAQIHEPDPAPLIAAAREVRMIMMDGQYGSKFECLRKLHAALLAYDAQREGT